MEYVILLLTGPLSDASTHEGFNQQDKRNVKISALGPLKDNERKDLNCAVKEYLLLAGYRLAAMTFIEEVRIICVLVFIFMLKLPPNVYQFLIFVFSYFYKSKCYTSTYDLFVMARLMMLETFLS